MFGLEERTLAGEVRAFLATRTARLAPLVVLVRLLSLWLVLSSPTLFPGLFDVPGYLDNFHDPGEDTNSRAILFQTWDAAHYLHVASSGYHAGEMSCCFYPLWPFLIRVGSLATAGNLLVAGLVLANLLSLAGLLLLHREVEATEGETVADVALAVALAYPGAIFLELVYSEALFFPLAVAFLAALRRGRLPWAGAAAFLLPLARPVGIFVALPLAVKLLRRGAPPRERAWLLAPLLGWAVYFLVLQVATGNAFEGFRLQRLFAQQASVAGLVDVPGFFRHFFAVDALFSYRGGFLDRVAFVWWAATLVACWRRDRVAFAYLLPLGLVPATGNAFVSYARCLLVAFPVFVETARFLARESRKTWLAALLVVLGALQVVFLVRHVNHHWVG